jgi:hypothetical protein
VAASSTQVDVGRNAGGTHAGHTPRIYTHGTLAVLAVSDNISQRSVLINYIYNKSNSYYLLVRRRKKRKRKKKKISKKSNNII